MFKRGKKANSFSEILENIEKNVDRGEKSLKDPFYGDVDISYMKRVYRVGRVSVAYYQAIPEEYFGGSEIVAIKNRIIFVNVENPIILQELGMMKEEILENINRDLDVKIENVVFKLGKLKNDVETIEEIITEKNLDSIDVSEEKFEFDSVNDEEIREKLNTIYSSFERIKSNLKKRGFIKCKTCGNLYHSSFAECDLCSLERNKRINLGIYFLRENPWSSLEEFTKKTGLGEEIYELSKKRLINSLKKKIERKLLSEVVSLKRHRKEIFKELMIFFNVVEGRFISSPTLSLVENNFSGVMVEHLKMVIGEFS